MENKNVEGLANNDGVNPFVLEGYQIENLSNKVILENSIELPDTTNRGYLDLQPDFIDINRAVFFIAYNYSPPVSIDINQTDNSISIKCSCTTNPRKLCIHGTRLLYNLINKRELKIFFDLKARYNYVEPIALEYGFDTHDDFDQYFDIRYENRSAQVVPKSPELLLINNQTVKNFQEILFSNPLSETNKTHEEEVDAAKIMVLSQHKFYENFQLTLFRTNYTKTGKLKNPFDTIDPLDLIAETNDPAQLKFLSALVKFQVSHRKKSPKIDIELLRSIIANPFGFEFYIHDNSLSENINSTSVKPSQLKDLPMELHIQVDQKGQFYEISGKLILNNKSLSLESFVLKNDYFILLNETLYLIENEDILRVILFFKQYQQKIIIHQSKFEQFRINVLGNLERKIQLTYSFLKTATANQKKENGFNLTPTKQIYLEDFGSHVMFTPVIKYGDVEVPVFSRMQIYSVDSHGNPFTVSRDFSEEDRFVASLVRQHPDFEEQLGKPYFALPKHTLLENDWFLDTFAEWMQEGIAVLGFSQLTKKRLNVNKPKLSVQVNSGINWFDSSIHLFFGKQKVSLKHLHKAVKNRTKYIELDDGTSGLIPEEWLDQFASYFEIGEVKGESILTSKIQFDAVREAYDAHMMSPDAKQEIDLLEERLDTFANIKEVKVPKAFKGTLRKYQKQGLNWLNFLDEFNFGGCLADDMGLGKTIQIIAFLVQQKEKNGGTTNLVIAPTSLLFNWENEIRKFAPGLRTHTIYGSDRVRDDYNFEDYDVILTSYGTMLNDVQYLKKFDFNYVILDESQNIKNPDSLRYKAVCLLKARNRIVLTGTPVENNTFDLFGQLSFACPGLLGTKTQFKNYFSTPIDRFQDSEKALELQTRIRPFVLRRTKNQVAKELPPKTEMILYCEMGEEQRKLYNAYEQEFYVYLNSTGELDIPRERLHILQGLTKLRQICNSVALLNDDLYYGNASAKIEVLMDQIESKSPQHKILVFSQFVSMLDLVKKELLARKISFEYLTGQTKDREARVDNFQTQDHVRVFLISLKAGGTGLNLTQADYVYLIDPWWNPAVENQAIDRSYRIGQSNHVMAVRMICPGTIEEKILQLQETKKDLADDLIKTDIGFMKTLSKSDLLSLVRPK